MYNTTNEMPLWAKIWGGATIVTWIAYVLAIPAAMWTRAFAGGWSREVTDALWWTWGAGLILLIVSSICFWVVADRERWV